MRILYCMHSIYNPGGMERVLLNKVRYLAEQKGWDVTIVTTDQKGRPPFYPFPPQVRILDLRINYSDDNGLPVCRKVLGYLRRRRLHRRRLTELLLNGRFEVVVSLYPSESSFIPSIKDGSRKVLELHYCKFFRLQYGRGGLLGMADRWRTWQDERIVRRFDKFVVLTHEDRGYWGHLPNIEVIPNAAMNLGTSYADVAASRRVIAVGRLDYQKGFDRLIEAWREVQAGGRFADWRLDIYGQGEWRDMLNHRIDAYGLSATACIHPPTADIGEAYASSALLAMSSHYEGFPMVMIEAMACGLPVVTFGFKCGPADIIHTGRNGLVVPEGDIPGLARALVQVMEQPELRRRMGVEARRVVHTYSEEAVMERWLSLFASLVRA